MMHIDWVTLAGLSGLFGFGAILKSIADAVLHRKRDRIDIAAIAVQVQAQVMAEMRNELQDTRNQLTETRAALDSAHLEISELRNALARAVAELAKYGRNYGDDQGR